MNKLKYDDEYNFENEVSVEKSALAIYMCCVCGDNTVFTVASVAFPDYAFNSIPAFAI